MTTTPTYRQPFVGEPDLVTHTGFILAEEDALKKYVSNITVPKHPDSNVVQTVGVWYRFPEGERNIVYPFITLDMIDVAPDYPLWTSEHYVNPEGLYRPSVSPELPPTSPGMNWDVRPYLAFQLTYQVTVHTRSAMHDKYLTSLFFTDIFPPRPFWLGVDADNTWRRTELVDFAQADMPETTESGTKRIFRKMYTVTIMAEIPQDRLYQSWQVLKVLVPLVDQRKVIDYAENVLKVGLDPLTNISQDIRTRNGELAYYYNISANVDAGTATAVGSALNVTPISGP